MQRGRSSLSSTGPSTSGCRPVTRASARQKCSARTSATAFPPASERPFLCRWLASRLARLSTTEEYVMSVNNNTSRHPTDHAAFQNLYNSHRERLLASVTGLVRDQNRAQDITAAAFQIAWEKRAQ